MGRKKTISIKYEIDNGNFFMAIRNIENHKSDAYWIAAVVEMIT
ncbi:MAG: hypothetical protein RR034_04900 [Bacteroidales bacterium]